MRPVPGAPLHTVGETVLAATGRTVMAAAAAGILTGLHRSAVSSPMLGDCTTCMATCGSGCRIAGTTVMWAPRQTAVPGRVGIAVSACFGVATGPALRGSCVPPFAPGMTARSASLLPASAWPRTSRAKTLYGLLAQDSLPGFPGYLTLFPFSARHCAPGRHFCFSGDALYIPPVPTSFGSSTTIMNYSNG